MRDRNLRPFSIKTIDKLYENGKGNYVTGEDDEKFNGDLTIASHLCCELKKIWQVLMMPRSCSSRCLVLEWVWAVVLVNALGSKVDLGSHVG